MGLKGKHHGFEHDTFGPMVVDQYAGSAHRRALLFLGTALLGCGAWEDAGRNHHRAEPQEAERAAFEPSGRVAARATAVSGKRDETRGGSEASGNARRVDYVVLVTVDGLAPRFLAPLVEGGYLPAFRALQDAGAWTHNARTDYEVSVTLPNHTSVFTGRPVSPSEGVAVEAYHGYTANSQPSPDATLHDTGNPALPYVQGVFDVVHDNGMKTCFLAGKDKFVVFEQSWGERFGAPDLVGEDNGRDKLDEVLIAHGNTPLLIDTLLQMQAARPCNLLYLHVTDPDGMGHSVGWGSDPWLTLLRDIDVWIGRVFRQITSDERLEGRTALILTADHGGEGQAHSDASNPHNYTVPFYVFAPGVPGGSDLYGLLRGRRFDPGSSRPTYASPRQPIRNGDAGPLALELLGLPPLPGATMGHLGLVTTGAW